MKIRKLILTKDGSQTIYDESTNASFHSLHGALTESRHVFINNGLAYFKNFKSNIRILELGFGTGLNAYLSYCYSIENYINISYHALELHPLEYEIVKALNYSETVDPANKRLHLNSFHNLAWNEKHQLHQNFEIIKYHVDALKFEPDYTYDLIYYDAFDPNVQEELWTAEAFQKIYKWMNPSAILCTYCAKGIVKRTLKQTGFEVETLAGPPGKREMIRAHKK